MEHPAQPQAHPRLKRLTFALSLLAVVAMPALPLGLILLGNAARDPNPGQMTSPTGAPSPPTLTGAVPPGEVAAAHTAMHDLGAACTQDSDQENVVRARAALERILAFNDMYPHAQFRIDDEPQTTRSLLRAIRRSAGGCPPGIQRRLDRAIRETI